MTVEKRIERIKKDLITIRTGGDVPNSKANIKMIDALLKAEKAINDVDFLYPRKITL